MARAADVLSAFRPGMGQQELVGLHQRYGGFTPAQAAAAHGQASTFYGARGRAPDEGELEDIYQTVLRTMTPQPPAQPVPLNTGGRAQHGAVADFNRQPPTGMVDRGGSAWGGMMPDQGRDAAYNKWRAEVMGDYTERFDRAPSWWTGPGMTADAASAARPQAPWPAGYMPGGQTGVPPWVDPNAAAANPGAFADWNRRRMGGPTQTSWPMPTMPMVQQPRQNVPRPWQVNPAVWDSMGNLGQQLALSFAEDEGWDAGDYQRQIDATRPVGSAPRGVQTVFQRPRGMGG